MGPLRAVADANSDMRRRAVSLVARLCALDVAHAALEDEVDDLRAQLAGRPPRQAASASSAFEPPAVAHPWPLALDPAADAAALAPYDRRPDDAAILEARAGEAFRRRFALAGRAPRHAAAVRALIETGRTLAPGAPVASIIVPVHGQLGWTLNCLHALLRHRAAVSAEVIVVDDGSPDATAALLGPLAAALPGLRLLSLARHLGFVAACNAGAAEARGQFLVLLNNDTRVVEGWLDALVESFALFPDAGLVGSKLLYPDGRLQEAGGIVWRDGTAWNYGRGDDPNRPQFCHARRVDYVSGASIAVPATLWRSLGGLDPRYAPAYGEDADLALRLRARGRPAWMQPRSRVIHYEGKTSGTDVARGAKSHQVANQRKLFLRWHATLETHRRNGEQPYLERERGVTRRALVVDATTPTPAQDAGSVTTVQTLRLLHALGYQPHFVPQDNWLFEPEHTPELLRLGVECAYAPYDTDFVRYIERSGGLFDVVIVYRAPVLHRVLPALRRHAAHAPVLFHAMDLHHLRLEREAALRHDPATRAEAAAMRGRELALVAAADCTITHSTHERALLAAAVPGAPVVVWPFMSDCHGTAAGFAARRDVCFLGGYRHPPNVDAATFFARDVLPLLRARLPGVRFVAAGANPGADVRALAGAAVEVTGQVDDLRRVFDRVRVFVCPVRYGAGTKGKITAAMAYGLPVVSTACGIEGMDLVDGQDVLVADTPPALAAACARLHEDAALWARLSARGLAIVRARHSLAMGRDTLAAAIETALAHRLGLARPAGGS